MAKDMYDIALEATDAVLGAGTYAAMNKDHPDPGVHAAIARSKSFVFEGVVHPLHVDTEDNGQSKIWQAPAHDDGDEGLFVRVQSWDSEKVHRDFTALIDKRVRVTVEIVDG